MAFLDPINTITTKKIVPGVVDNVFRNSPLLAMVKKQSLEPWPGGFAMQENFLYNVLNVTPYSPGDTFDLSQVQIATGCTVTPRYYNVPVSAYIEKLKVEMAGPQAVFSYIDLLMQTAALSLSGRLATDLYKHGQNVSGDDRSECINGLDEALNDGSTNGYAGRSYSSYLTITRSDVDSALNSPMSSPSASQTALNYPLLEEVFSSCVIGPEMPKLIITTNKGWSYVKQVFQPQQRIEGSDPDFGFMYCSFNGAKIVADQYCPGSRTATSADTKLGYSAIAGETMWFLNPEHFRFYVSTDPLLGFGFTGFMPSQNSSVVAGHYKFCGNFTVQAPRLMRYIYGFTA